MITFIPMAFRKTLLNVLTDYNKYMLIEEQRLKRLSKSEN